MASFDTFTKSEFVAAAVVTVSIANGAFQLANYENRMEAMESRPPEEVWAIVTEQSPAVREDPITQTIARIAAMGRSTRLFGGVNVESEFDAVSLPSDFTRSGGLVLAMEMASNDGSWSDWQERALNIHDSLCSQSNCLSDQPGTMFEAGDVVFLREGSVDEQYVVPIECPTAEERGAQQVGSPPGCRPGTT